MKSKRTQEQRTAATQAALVTAARGLFSTRGYTAVGTEELARAAGVTRGALYHQFGGKVELFAAVVEQVEQEVVAAIADRMVAAGVDDPAAALIVGVDAWMDACADPEVHQLLLIDAPAALGWERWREIAQRYGAGLVEGTLAAGMDAGSIPTAPVAPLAAVLIGALDEGALYAARADDPRQAGLEVRAALKQLIAAMLAS